jgi:hypothetical protein
MVDAHCICSSKGLAVYRDNRVLAPQGVWQVEGVLGAHIIVGFIQELPSGQKEDGING